jgi:hypothetical protein
MGSGIPYVLFKPGLPVAADLSFVNESAVCYIDYSGDLVDLANKPSDWERMSLWSGARRLMTISVRSVARS